MFSILKFLVFLPKYTILSGFTESWGMTLDIIHVISCSGTEATGNGVGRVWGGMHWSSLTWSLVIKKQLQIAFVLVSYLINRSTQGSLLLLKNTSQFFSK